MPRRRPLTPLSPNERPGSELSFARKNVVYGRGLAGQSADEIAEVESLPKSTVQSVLKRGQQRGHLNNLARSGRPKETSVRDERKVLRIARRMPQITYSRLREEAGLDISRSSYYRILRRHGISNWIAKRRPHLTEDHARLRLKFARRWIHLTEAEWSTFIFSDECSVERGKGKKRVWSFSTPAQKWDKDKVQTFSKSKTTSVMVWAGIAGNLPRTELIIMTRDPTAKKNGYTTKSYIQALEEGLLPVYDGQTFMQDNASIHTAHAARAWFEEQGIYVLPDWPPYSPDLNPIEHLWFHLKNAVYDVVPHLDTITGVTLTHTLEEALPKAWDLVKSEIIQEGVKSMPRRLQAVIDAEGWHTKY